MAPRHRIFTTPFADVHLLYVAKAERKGRTRIPIPALMVGLVLIAGRLNAGHAIPLSGASTLAFASVDEGRALLEARDDFVRRMSPFDRASRMKTDREVSEDEYLRFVGAEVLDWDDAEREEVSSVIAGLRPRLESLDVPLPREVSVVKTTGREEGGAAYTRGTSIILPQGKLKAGPGTLRKTICHEIFHIMSRFKPDLADQFYASIGYVRCQELPFPMDLAPRKITNPDAPGNDHCIRLHFGGREVWAVPILHSRTQRYDTRQGGEFFGYLQFRLLLVDRSDQSLAVTPILEDRRPVLVGVQDVSGFFEQVGRNTEYIIHPEEILADNFAFLVLGYVDLPSPEIVSRMERIFVQRGTATPPGR